MIETVLALKWEEYKKYIHVINASQGVAANQIHFFVIDIKQEILQAN